MDYLYSGVELYYDDTITTPDDYDKNKKALEDIAQILLKNNIIEKNNAFLNSVLQ